MDVIIRKATPVDFQASVNITREAFWNVYKPGCDEHLVLHKLRESTSYIADLDLVALDDDRLVGHIISTRARVVAADHSSHEVLCLGPVSVLPQLQKSGVGSKLIWHTLNLAREAAYRGVILFGNPEYYHRFGFVNAEQYHITTKDGQNFEPFMALELQPSSLSEVSGKFFEDPFFIVEDAELEAFEKQFPYKEKLVTDTQIFH